MGERISRLSGVGAAFAAALTVAACAERPEPAPVVYRGTQPSAPQPRPAAPAVDNAAIAALQPGAADARGVVDYGGYRAVVARQGDTVASMASRVGLSPAALAAYNGLPAGYQPRAGDELILPPSPGGTSVAQVSAPTPLETPLETPPAAPEAPAPSTAAAAGATGFDIAAIEASLGDDAAPPSPTPQSGTPEAAPTPTPAPAPAPDPATPPAPAEAPVRDAPSSVAVVEPAPAPAVVAPPPPAPATFAAPVSGPIVRPYSRAAGAGRNDGVDFGATTGAPVSAAADGQVALVSESLGGLQTIVLIRHANDLLTVYGHVDGVTVAQGDRVRKGQTIGVVAAPESGTDAVLHFEVRRGAASVDPSEFLPG
ncbi:M23 family metallopeptidase [Rubrimonas cliftonensis]|uniref:Murein DD-endopeptidase MepM and murein hydrolase activator NlpD, contain LysM domain n=1 Tax=Rubrimonas cliftonensis TaxID=89524 RepID=A0A1H3VMI3_9RHOB|nr:M23 family metallopeptidase [Rubrimonas cliftonensis]SDZ75996.1 Murein DD-endopeptidase MepM and murein hydrolase activator NlpD, contain LysM domain [Rubrimonas cliftonensis]